MAYSLISIAVNSLVFVFGSYLNVFLLELLHIQGYERVVIWGAFIVSMIPMIFVQEVFEQRREWEEGFLLFWKRQRYSYEVKKQLYFMGVIPVGEATTITSRKTFDQPPLSIIARDISKILPSFIPFANSYIYLILNVLEERKALGSSR
ncbi:MAG: hypothetical protein OHK0037_07150 [Elainellaceae cyanobacterium]